MTTPVEHETSNLDALVETLERMRFQLQLAEAQARSASPYLADMLSDIADEAQHSLQKLDTVMH